MKKVLVRGPALTQSGYGEHTRFVLRSLKQFEDLFDIYLINVNWGQTSWLWTDNEERRWIDSLLAKTVQYGQSNGQFDLSVQVQIPNEFEKLAPINVGVTAGVETTKMSPQWLEGCLRVDRIVTISQHAKYALKNTQYSARNNQTGEDFVAKVLAPIEVVEYPVKCVHPDKNFDIDLKYDFNFLTVGTFIPRKNLPNTIKWFVEQFYDDEVGLVIKTSTAKNSLIDRRHTHDKLKKVLEEYEGRTCEVYLLHGDMTEEEMTALYQHPKIKSLVSLSHGEGFGLPLYEAAYNGLPIVAPNWSGQCDFLNMPVKDKKGKAKNLSQCLLLLLMISGLVQAEAVWDGVIQKDSMWCFPKEWDYKKALKSVVKNYASIESNCKKVAKAPSFFFSWNHDSKRSSLKQFPEKK
jgi:glycosyltransferase involved in cell wall biosynthesis